MATQPVLRYGGDHDFPPFESVDKSGRAQGFQIDLLKEMAREGGFGLIVELDDWRATERRFRAGELDAIAMVDIATRRTWARFLRSHATPIIGVYRRREQADPQSPQDFAGMRVAVHDSPPLQDSRAVYLGNIGAKFIETASPQASLQAVRDREADFALMPRAYGDRLLGNGALAEVVAGSMSLRLQSYAFAVRPDDGAWQQRIEAALASLVASGRLEALRVKWLGSRQAIAANAALQQRVVTQRWVGLGVAAAGTLVLSGLSVLLVRRTRFARAERARRREAEAALAEAEARLAQAFANNADAMVVTARLTGTVLDVNSSLCRLIGVTPDEVIGKQVDSLPALADAANLRSLREMIDREGRAEGLPLHVNRADGQSRSFLVSSELMCVGNEQHVFSILRDVTERLQADAAARAVYDALAAELAAVRKRSVEVQQSAEWLTTTLAHDLKAPLHVVRGLIGLQHRHLEGGDLAQARANAQQIDQAARRMDTMVAWLARIAQVQRAELRRQRVDMRAMALSVCTQSAKAMPQPKIDFSVTALPDADADVELIAQVWQQLIGNAWKFARREPGQKVLVDSFKQDHRTWYRVVDNGVGFDRAAATHLFVPFQRMHRASEYAGLGVGLALAQRIVRQHGGEIRLNSGVGAGTVAEFTLG